MQFVSTYKRRLTCWLCGRVALIAWRSHAEAFIMTICHPEMIQIISMLITASSMIIASYYLLNISILKKVCTRLLIAQPVTKHALAHPRYWSAKELSKLAAENMWSSAISTQIGKLPVLINNCLLYTIDSIDSTVLPLLTTIKFNFEDRYTWTAATL